MPRKSIKRTTNEPGPSTRLARISTRAIAKNRPKPNPLFQADTLDMILSFFEHNDPKTFLTLRLVCKFWSVAVTRWIRKTLRWRVGRSTELNPLNHTQEQMFTNLLSNYAAAGAEIPEIFINFHLLHNNTGSTRVSEQFIDTISPRIVDLRILGSRRSYIDRYLPPCALELRKLEMYKLSQVGIPDWRKTDDFAFGNVTFPKLEDVILRGMPHSSTVEICIKLLNNSPKLQRLMLGLQTAGICQVIDAAAKGGLNLTRLTTLRTHVHYKHYNLIYGDNNTAHLSHPQMGVLGNICPNLTHIAIAISDTNEALNAAIEMLNLSYAKQLVELEVIVREMDPLGHLRNIRDRRARLQYYMELAERHREVDEHMHVLFEYQGERHELFEVGNEFIELPAYVVMMPLQRELRELEEKEVPARRPRQIQLNSFPVLTRLHLENWPLHNNYNLFIKLPCLKSVELHPQLSDEAHVVPMRLIHSKVSSVRFIYDRVTGDTIEALATVFPNMKELEISDPLRSAYSRMWTEWPGLKKLKLCACKRAVRRRQFEDPFADEGLTGIFRQVLRGLATNVTVNPASLRRDSYIGDLKNLEDLTIELLENQITQRVVDFGFAHLPALRWLKITMQQEQATLAVKSMVDNCPRLRRLDVRDSGIRFLQARVSKINDVDYAMLKRPDLEIVPTEELPPL